MKANNISERPRDQDGGAHEADANMANDTDDQQFYDEWAANQSLNKTATSANIASPTIANRRYDSNTTEREYYLLNDDDLLYAV